MQLLPFFVLFLILCSLLIHGYIIMNEVSGYQQDPSVKKHPEMKNVKKGEKLLVINFTDDDLIGLYKRIEDQKLQELFEEPSTYEDDLDDDSWYPEEKE